jgi:hypothetical protein
VRKACVDMCVYVYTFIFLCVCVPGEHDERSVSDVMILEKMFR